MSQQTAAPTEPRPPTVGLYYVYLCEVDGVIRYVGQSCQKQRINQHFRALQRPEKRSTRFYVFLREAISRGAKVSFYKIGDRLTRADALAFECNEIRKRRDQLWNTVTPGRPKISDQEFSVKMSAVARKRGENPETRQRASAAAVRAAADPNLRAKRAAATAKLWEDPGYRTRN